MSNSQPAPPAPQETAGEAVAWHPEDGPNPACMKCGYFKDSTGGCKCGHVPLGEAMAAAHPTPAAAPTDNTALVERERIAKALETEADLIPCLEDAEVMQSCARMIRADFDPEVADALSSRPAEATSREGVEEAARLRALLACAESFISGFEGDAMQDGIDVLLREIRAGIVS